MMKFESPRSELRVRRPLHYRYVGAIFFAATLLAAIFFVSGCLRYVPSRSELEKNASAHGVSFVAGPEEFQRYEEKLNKRLEQLVQDRSSLQLVQGDSSYRIAPSDVLDLVVFGLKDLSTTTDVGADGLAVFPLIGSVHASGLTLGDLRSQVEGKLRPYVRNPRIQLTLKERLGNRVSVIGAVTKPGMYPLQRTGQTLTEVLSMAGGRSERAGNRLILIPAGSGPGGALVDTGQLAGQVPAISPAVDQRSAGLQPVAFPSPVLSQPAYGLEIDLDLLTGTLDRRPVVIPLIGGDTVVVPEAGTFKVDGEVEKPGSFQLTAKTSSLGAVASAGGFTYSANVNEVEVIRDIGSGKKASVVLDLEQVAMNGAPDVPLRDGDIVRVPSHPGRFRTRQIVDGINGFFRGSVSATAR